MILESLLILACISPNNDSCGKTLDAYGRQTGYQKMIDQYGEKNPKVAFLVGSVGLAKSKHLYYQIVGPFFHDINTEGQTFWFKKDF